MQSEINNSVIQHLLAEAQRDGIQKLVVGAVIEREGKVLFLKRVSSEFMGELVELPSGAIEEDEELLIALMREVQEETGLEVTIIIRYLGAFDYKSRSGKKTRQFNFLVETAPGDVKLNPTEHQVYYFVSLSDEEFSTLNISDAVKAVLKDSTMPLMSQKLP